MRAVTGWQYRPYRPYDRMAEANLPFICRIAPEQSAIELEWLDAGGLCAHTLFYKKADGGGEYRRMPADAGRLRVEGLEANADYELYIARKDSPEKRSAPRYARTGHAPGKVVNYLHPKDEIYAFSGRSLCSPSLVRLPSGALLASMDVFVGNGPQNLQLLFRSDDRGQSWRYVCDLFPSFWGQLFYHRDRLYMLSCSTEYGDVLIGASDDEGASWTPPTHLLAGSSSNAAPGWQRAPFPPLCNNGRLYFSLDFGAWSAGGHSVGMMSVREDSDILDGKNWLVSGMAAYDPAWPGAPEGKSSGLLEGNMLLSPDGRIFDLLRVEMPNCTPSHGRALLFEFDREDPEAAPKFHRFIDMPSGGNSKSHVLFDNRSKKYVAIGNICVDPATPRQRNVLALQASEDLYDWRTVKILLDYRGEDPNQVGLQYISFIFDGEDILYLSRTAINGARNFHDANYSTFHVIENFRQYL